MIRCAKCGNQINPYDGYVCIHCGQTISRFTVREDGLVHLQDNDMRSSPLFRVIDGTHVAFWDKKGRREIIVSLEELENLLDHKT